jgi:hypothetical protein
MHNDGSVEECRGLFSTKELLAHVHEFSQHPILSLLLFAPRVQHLPFSEQILRLHAVADHVFEAFEEEKSSDLCMLDAR